jgi:hypothetical protein
MGVILIAHRFVSYVKENKNTMGTRGLTRVLDANGVVRVAQYGQWDHYPSGQGITALNFIRDESNLRKLEKNLGLIYYPSKDELENMFAHQYTSLHRDTGAGILELIANEHVSIPLYLDEEFADDELFCEGIYTVDFSTKLFTTKYHNKELTMTFDMAKDITDDFYLTLTECQVYAYEKSTAVA